MAASPASLRLAPHLKGVHGPLSEPGCLAGKSPLRPRSLGGLSSEKPSLLVLWWGVSTRAFHHFCLPRRCWARPSLGTYPAFVALRFRGGHTSHCCAPAQGLAGVTAFGSAAM